MHPNLMCVQPLIDQKASYVTGGWGATSPGPPGRGMVGTKGWSLSGEGDVAEKRKARAQRGWGRPWWSRPRWGASLCPYSIHFSAPPLNLYPQSPQDVKDRAKKWNCKRLRKSLYIHIHYFHFGTQIQTSAQCHFYLNVFRLTAKFHHLKMITCTI